MSSCRFDRTEILHHLLDYLRKIMSYIGLFISLCSKANLRWGSNNYDGWIMD